MTNYLARMKSVGVRRDKSWLIRNFDLTVKPGEIVSIIGPNGGGKTTAVKVLTGLIRPDAGTVEIRQGTRMGYVPQRVFIGTTLPMTVRRMMKLTDHCSDDEVDSALSDFKILKLAERPVQYLSGGELQRLLFSRAVLKKPDLLICDEPSQGLDTNGEQLLIEDIHKVRDRINCGIIWISHKLHFVMSKTDQVLCVNGHICCSGTPSQVVRNEIFEQIFGTEVAKSLAFYRHDHDHDHQDLEVDRVHRH